MKQPRIDHHVQRNLSCLNRKHRDAFSEDDGKTWSEPVVVAYDPLKPGNKQHQHRLAYPFLYEHRPGEIWITTMQGKLRIKMQESDF